MVALKYVGVVPDPRDGQDLVNRLQATTILASGPISQIDMTTQVATAAATYGSTSYVDGQDATLASVAYYTTHDALQVPTASIGQANGVAALDSGGKVPLSQLPSMGAGYLLGPFGATAVFSGSAGSTPLKIADFNIGVQALEFRPLIFANVFATCTGNGYPVIEARISDGSAIYSSQTLIGMGVGRVNYNDLQSISVLPVCASTSQVGTATGFPNTYATWISLWLMDGGGQTSTVNLGGLVSGAAFLVRDVL